MFGLAESLSVFIKLFKLSLRPDSFNNYSIQTFTCVSTTFLEGRVFRNLALQVWPLQSLGITLFRTAIAQMWSPGCHVHRQHPIYIYIYIYIYISVSKRFLHCPSPRLHCFLSSHWPSFEPLSRFFSMCVFFLGDGGSGPSTQPPTWRTSVSLFVWVLSFDLSSNGGRTSSYATADIAFWIIAPCKPPYLAKDAFVKVEILQGGHPMYLNKL